MSQKPNSQPKFSNFLGQESWHCRSHLPPPHHWLASHLVSKKNRLHFRVLQKSILQNTRPVILRKAVGLSVAKIPAISHCGLWKVLRFITQFACRGESDSETNFPSLCEELGQIRTQISPVCLKRWARFGNKYPQFAYRGGSDSKNNLPARF